MGNLDGSEKVLGAERGHLEGVYLPRPLESRFFPVSQTWGNQNGTALDFLGAAAKFRPRTKELEDEPEFKQFVTYGVLCRSQRFWVYRRAKAGSEARLHGRLSLGLGGHINLEDIPTHLNPPWAGLLYLHNALVRELTEEVGYAPAPITPGGPVGTIAHCVGLVNDESNPVGAVHLGVVMLVEAPQGWEPKPADGSVIPVGWLSVSQIRVLAEMDSFESWSALIIPHLGRLAALLS